LHKKCNVVDDTDDNDDINISTSNTIIMPIIVIVIINGALNKSKRYEGIYREEPSITVRSRAGKTSYLSEVTEIICREIQMELGAENCAEPGVG
jgi:hypothetical protein